MTGFLDKTHNVSAPVGLTIFTMLQALGVRGLDSAGVALYSHQHDDALVVRVKVGKHDNVAVRSQHIAERVQAAGCRLGDVSTMAAYFEICPLGWTSAARHTILIFLARTT